MKNDVQKRNFKKESISLEKDTSVLNNYILDVLVERYDCFTGNQIYAFVVGFHILQHRNTLMGKVMLTIVYFSSKRFCSAVQWSPTFTVLMCPSSLDPETLLVEQGT